MKLFSVQFFLSQSSLLVLVQLILNKWINLMLMIIHCLVENWTDTLQETLYSLFHSENSKMILTDLPKKFWQKSQVNLQVTMHQEILNLIQRRLNLKYKHRSILTIWWKTRCSKWWRYQRISLFIEKWWWLTTWPVKDTTQTNVWHS